MKSFIQAWALANLLVGLVISPVVLHVALNSNNNAPLEEPTTEIDYWEDYKQSKWY